MVARLWSRERQDRRRKEHGLVIRVRNQEADALVLQRGETRLDDTGGVHVEHGQKHRYAGNEKHVGLHLAIALPALLGPPW